MKRTTILLGMLLAALTAKAEPIVVNGSFTEEVPRNGSGGGWASENVDGGGGWKETLGSPAPCFRLNDAGSSGTDPRIWQEVTGFEPGQTYTLMGDYSLGFSGGSPDQSFEVRIDGNTALALGPAPEHGSGSSVFAPLYPHRRHHADGCE